MSNCNRCGKTLHGLLPGFLCPECKSIEREREEDREREEEREEQAASDLSEMLSESVRSREQSREDIAAAAVYIADAKNNPGDYYCPSCKFRTLKKGASRCPKCHADPGLQYWAEVEAKEREAWLRAKAAEDEWKRGEPARAAAARAAAAIKERTGRWSIFWTFYYLYLLPTLVLTSGLFFVSGQIPALDWNTLIMALPGLNWLAILGLMFANASQRLIVFYGLIFWAILGGILWLATKPNAK